MAAAEAGHLPRLRPAVLGRRGPARACPTPSAASGWTPSASPGTAGWPRRGSRGGGADVHAASQENGLEGVVAKRLDSPYRPGVRSPDWRKIKNFRTQSVVVGGWRPGQGRRAGGDRARCCSASPTTRGGWSTPGTSAPGSPTRTCADLQRMFTAADDVAVRRRPCRARSPATRTGSSPTSWARSPTRCGRRTAGCGTRRGGACATTWSPTTWWSSREPGKQRVEIDGRTLSVSNLEKVLFPEVVVHQGAGHRLLRPGRAGAAAAPRRPPGDLHPLAGRRRGPDLLREEQRAARPRVGPAGDDPQPGQLDRPGDARHGRPRVGGRPRLGGQPRRAGAARAAVAGRRRRRAAAARPAGARPRPGPGDRAGRVLRRRRAAGRAAGGRRPGPGGEDLRLQGHAGLRADRVRPTASTPAGTPGRWRRSCPPRRRTTSSGGWRRCCGPARCSSTGARTTRPRRRWRRTRCGPAPSPRCPRRSAGTRWTRSARAPTRRPCGSRTDDVLARVEEYGDLFDVADARRAPLPEV